MAKWNWVTDEYDSPDVVLTWSGWDDDHPLIAWFNGAFWAEAWSGDQITKPQYWRKLPKTPV